MMVVILPLPALIYAIGFLITFGFAFSCLLDQVNKVDFMVVLALILSIICAGVWPISILVGLHYILQKFYEVR